MLSRITKKVKETVITLGVSRRVSRPHKMEGKRWRYRTGIGRMDQGGGGGGGETLGPELLDSVDLSGVADSTPVATLPGWSLVGALVAAVVTAARFVITSAAANDGIRQTVASEVGETYRFECDYTGTGVANVVADGNEYTGATISEDFVASGTSIQVDLRPNGNAAGVGSFGGVTLKKVLS